MTQSTDTTPPPGVPVGADPVSTVNCSFHGGDLIPTVVDAVARANDVDPLDMRPRLCEVVDPDALERVFRPRGNGKRRQGGTIGFRMGMHVVVVDSGRNRVSVYEALDSGRGRSRSGG